MIFSNYIRTDEGVSTYAEPDYDYLERSAREEVKCIRSVLSDWYSRYPEDDKKDLLARFKSSDNLQHYSASFELYLHELLLKMGYTVVVHPETRSKKNTKPDFLVTDSEGNSFYLEAVMSIEDSKETQGVNARLNVVYDTVNKLKSSHFFISLDYTGSPKSCPSGRALCNRLNNWLETLDADEIIKNLNTLGHESLPKHSYKHDGWNVTFTAIPRSPEKRDGSVGNVIGSISGEARFLNTSGSIRDSLIKKGNRYGELEYPLVIAVSSHSSHLDIIDVMQALFGEEQFIFDAHNIEEEPRMERARNGLWYGVTGIKYTRISAVLIGYDIKPWTFGVRKYPGKLILTF